MLAGAFANDRQCCAMTAIGRFVSSMVFRCCLPFEHPPARLPILWDPRGHLGFYTADGNDNGDMARQGLSVQREWQWRTSAAAPCAARTLRLWQRALPWVMVTGASAGIDLVEASEPSMGSAWSRPLQLDTRFIVVASELSHLGACSSLTLSCSFRTTPITHGRDRSENPLSSFFPFIFDITEIVNMTSFDDVALCL